MKVENNLFDRLTDAALANFNLKKEEYPSSMKLLRDELESTKYITDLKYVSVLTLYDFNFIENLRISQVITLFND
jgi:hypothetical protein